MKYKIDLKNKKIFYLLTENSRLKTKDMAKRVGLSKNAVRYRIGKLLENGYIKKFLPITDFQRFGIHSYDLFLKTRGGEERIASYLSRHPNIIWSGKLFGKWDFFAQIAAKNERDFANILEEMTIFIGNSLEGYEVKSPVKRIKIDRTVYDCEKETGYKFKPKKTGSEIIKLDGLDKKILRYLNDNNGLAQYNEVAKATGSSLETARNRMLDLLKNGVIIKYAPYVDYAKLGIEMYLVFASFRYLTKESKNKVFAFIKHSDLVKIASEVFGRQEIYFLTMVKNPAELSTFIKDLESKFPDILSIEHMLITEELKLDFFPESLMNL